MKVFIVGGGGTLGSTTAFYLSSRDIVEEVILYDVSQPMAVHHSMDISQAVSTISRTKVFSADSIDDIRGSDIVIVAAGLAPSQFTGDFVADVVQFAPLMRELGDAITRLAPNAVVISMTNPVDVFNYLFWKISGLPAKHLLGFSNNDTIRMRWALGEYLNRDAREITAYVGGQHGPNRVQLYSTAAVDGKPAVSAEDIPAVGPVQGRWWEKFNATGVKRTAGWTSAVGVTAMVESILGLRENEYIPCSVLVNGENGFKDLSLGLPVKLSADGVKEILTLKLPADEQAQLEASAAVIKGDIAHAMEILSTQSPE